MRKKTFFIEWGSTLWYSCANGSGLDRCITDAGGINIAASSSVTYPTLSAEFVADANPDVILKSINLSNGTLSVFQNARNELLSRTATAVTTAFKTGQVFIFDSSIYLGLRNLLVCSSSQNGCIPNYS